MTLPFATRPRLRLAFPLTLTLAACSACAPSGPDEQSADEIRNLVPAWTTSSSLYALSDTRLERPLSSLDGLPIQCLGAYSGLANLGRRTLPNGNIELSFGCAQYRSTAVTTPRGVRPGRPAFQRRLTVSYAPRRAGADRVAAIQSCVSMMGRHRSTPGSHLAITPSPQGLSCTFYSSEHELLISGAEGLSKVQPPPDLALFSEPSLVLSLAPGDGVLPQSIDAGFSGQKVDAATYLDPQSPLHVSLDANFDPDGLTALPTRLRYQLYQDAPPAAGCTASASGLQIGASEFAGLLSPTGSSWGAQDIYAEPIVPHHDGTLADLHRTMYLRVILESTLSDPFSGELQTTCLVASNTVSIQVIDQWSIDQWNAKAALSARINDLEAQNYHRVSVVAYAPPKLWDDETAFNSDPLYRTAFTVDAGYQIYPAGCTFDVVGARNKIADYHQDALSDLLFLFDEIQKALAGAYENAKNYLATNVASLACGGNASCTSKLAPLLYQGINAGLASLGIPPTIPSRRELMQHGVSYLATQAAKEVAGPAGSLLNYAAYEASYQSAKSALEAGVNALAGCPLIENGGCVYYPKNPISWGLPDPYTHQRPAVLYLKIERGISDYAEIAGAAPEAIPTLGVLTILDQNKIWLPVTLPLPRFIPEEGIILPIVLRPTISDLGAWISQRFGEAQIYNSENPLLAINDTSFVSPQSYWNTNPFDFTVVTSGFYQSQPSGIVWVSSYSHPAGSLDWTDGYQNLPQVPAPTFCP